MELKNVGDIEAFVAAVRAGSFTKAAKALGLTRSAVGKSIVRLEARLGARLLNRTTRSLGLTDEGQVVFERCRRILEDLEEVDSIMAERKEVPTGILRVTAPFSFGQRQLLPAIDEYLQKWNRVEVDVSFTDRFTDIIEESFDLAVRIGDNPPDSRFITRTVGTQQFVACASRGYLDHRGVPQHPSALEGHDTIFFVRDGRRRSWDFSTPDGLEHFHGPGRLRMVSS